jgi:hypothetical protein
MSPSRTATTARSIVDDVLGRGMTREVWTGNFDKALPVSIQDFDLTAILPPVFYMFRFGHRRGKGKFLETFGGGAGSAREQKRAANIDHVARTLAAAGTFDGFGDDIGRAILGDLLLCYCLENAKNALGRQEQVQRVAPAHYMAGWIDLPEHVANLRYVPEMIVAMLADQKGDAVQQNREDDKTRFPVGQGFEKNVLLRAFHRGVERRGPLGDLAADRFTEDETRVGIDQLLMVRLAQQLGSAPDKLRGGEGEKIPNQRPIAERAARHFSDDIRRFVRAYAAAVPRHAFVELLEACIAVGLTTIVTGVIEELFGWAATGEIRQKCDQQPARLLVDCSNGVDRRLRALAEQSMDDFMRRTERFPVVLMALRLLDHGARFDPKLRKLDLPTRPYATEWLNLLGDVLFKRRDEAGPVLYELERKGQELADRLDEDYPEAAQILRDESAQPSPIWRLAEALTALQGRKNTQKNVQSLIDSALLIGRPNGLATKRTVIRQDAIARSAKKRDVRSLVFTDPVLEFLVHLHVLPGGNRGGYRPLSFRDFTRRLTDRNGLCVDEAPPGMTVSNDLLQANRSVLERRLRDLGLLVGVNDAEAMKHLQPRFRRPEGQDDLD